jgi:hypothetical protein
MSAEHAQIRCIFETSDTKGYDPDNYYAKHAIWIEACGNFRPILAIATIMYLEI